MRTTPGDSTSDNSEKILQRGGGKVTVHVILVKGEYMQSSAYFYEKVSASFRKLSESQTVTTMKDFSAFLDMRRYKNWAHKVSS